MNSRQFEDFVTFRLMWLTWMVIFNLIATGAVLGRLLLG